MVTQDLLVVLSPWQPGTKYNTLTSKNECVILIHNSNLKLRLLYMFKKQNLEIL